MKKIFVTVMLLVLTLFLFVGCKEKAQPINYGELYTYTKAVDYVIIDKYIGKEAQVVIPETIEDLPVTAIASHAFDNNQTINSVVIPDTVTEIGEYAFANCLRLKEAVVSKEITVLPEGMFAYSIDLEKLELKGTVTSVGSLALAKTALVSDESQEFVIIGDGVLVAYHSKGPNVILPEDVKNIGTVFIANEEIESIYIPEGIKTIPNSAFSNCTKLKEVTLPSSLTYIGTSAFSFCYGIESIEIPAGVTEIADMVFYNCVNLKNITLPDSIKSMGINVFLSCHKDLTVSAPFDSVAFRYCADNNIKLG